MDDPLTIHVFHFCIRYATNSFEYENGTSFKMKERSNLYGASSSQGRKKDSACLPEYEAVGPAYAAYENPGVNGKASCIEQAVCVYNNSNDHDKQQTVTTSNTRTHTHTHVHTHVHTHGRAHTHKRTRTHTHTRTNVRAHTHTHTLIYMHTQIFVSMLITFRLPSFSS